MSMVQKFKTFLTNNVYDGFNAFTFGALMSTLLVILWVAFSSIFFLESGRNPFNLENSEREIYYVIWSLISLSIMGMAIGFFTRIGGGWTSQGESGLAVLLAAIAVIYSLILVSNSKFTQVYSIWTVMNMVIPPLFATIPFRSVKRGLIDEEDY